MYWYDVFPQVVLADRDSTVRIHPRFEHVKLKKSRQLQIFTSPFGGMTESGMMEAYRWGSNDGEKVDYEMQGDDIILHHWFAGEQEHNIQLVITDRENPDFFERRSIKIYSLHSDLLSLRPFKGETHSHSSGSDGREDPRFVVARYREKGFDFAAVTDHGNYESSQTAHDFWQESVPDFNIVQGEEVHAPGNPVHIVNFGGTKSVNDMYRQNEECYHQEVGQTAENLPSDLSPEVRRITASCRWVFDRIRSVGGLAIYAHPFWKMSRNVLPFPVVDAVFNDRRYDAVELLGGFYREESEANNFQMIYCLEQWAKGNRFPVVGASDSHGSVIFPENRPSVVNFIGKNSVSAADADLFGWYFTVVLGENNSTGEVIRQIKAGNSVAVEAIPGNVPHIFGSLRLVKYVSFLLRELFPVLSSLYRAQGETMISLLAGEEEAAERLKLLSGRVDLRREKFFIGR